MLWRIDDDDEEEDVSNVISCSLLSALVLKFCMYIFVLSLLFLDFVKRKVKESVSNRFGRGLSRLQADICVTIWYRYSQ